MYLQRYAYINTYICTLRGRNGIWFEFVGNEDSRDGAGLVASLYVGCELDTGRIDIADRSCACFIYIDIDDVLIFGRMLDLMATTTLMKI